jgi:hypothetical protein
MNNMTEHLLTQAERALTEAGIGFTVIQETPVSLPTAA